MFHLNRIKYLILILFLYLFIPSVKGVVKPTKEFYVNDYANILSTETKEYIINKSAQLAKADGTQIVVVTVPDLDGDSLENYANTLFNSFGIGDKNKDNGLLLLLALEERLFRVEVGYGLEGILPDGKTGRFQDEYIIPYLKENKWDEGIKNGYDAFFAEIIKENNLDLDYNDPTSSTSYYDYTFNPMYLSIAFLIGFVCGIISNHSRYKGRLVFFYLIIWFLTFLIANLLKLNFVIYWVVNLFIYIFSVLDITFISIGHGSGGGWSSGGGGFSGGGFSGGGGHSGGGGSSRGF